MKYFFLMGLAFFLSSHTHEQSVQNLSRFMQANYHQFGNNLKKAAYWYEQITPNDHSQYIYLGYIPFLDACGHYDQIVALIPQLDLLFKNNNEMQILFAQALEKSGRITEGHTRLIHLNEHNTANQELAFKVAQLYLERKEPENALRSIDAFLNSAARRANNFIFHFMRAQIFIQMQRPAQALTALQQCIDLHPHFDKGWLLYALLQEQQGKLEQALNGYKTYLELSPQPAPEIEQHVLALTFKQKIPTVSNSPDLFEQALQLFDHHNYKQALTSIDRYLQQPEARQSNNTLQAQLLKIQILVALEDFPAIIKTLSAWIQSKNNPDLCVEVIHTLTYVGLPYAPARALFHSFESLLGGHPDYVLYQADLALKERRPKEAMAFLQKAFTGTTDAARKASIGFQMALIYFDEGSFKKALTLLESLPEHSFAPAHNLLAYLYALTNYKLETAEKLIKQVLSADEQNPHFLDTYAFILLRQKKFEQALPIFEKIASIHPRDFMILTNTAQCHYACGNRTTAFTYLKSAQEIAQSPGQKKISDDLKNKWAKQ